MGEEGPRDCPAVSAVSLVTRGEVTAGEGLSAEGENGRGDNLTPNGE